jgi:hypothetical protein
MQYAAVFVAIDFAQGANGLVSLVDQYQRLCIEGNDFGPRIVEICHKALG